MPAGLSTALPLLRKCIDFGVANGALYALLFWARRARATRLAIGAILLFALSRLAGHFDLFVTSWVLAAASLIVALAVLMVYQSGLRSMLIGLDSLVTSRPRIGSDLVDQRIAEACFRLAKGRLGALIVIRGRDQLDEVTSGGTMVNAEISAELLVAIFQKTSPLHDGAVVVDGTRVALANVVLPLTAHIGLPQHYGTRHRAALGLSETCDALVIVVSEETGEVRLATGNVLRVVGDSTELAGHVRQYSNPARRGTGSRLRWLLREDVPLKAATLLLTSTLWAFSLLSTASTVRTVSLPIELENVPAGLEVRWRSASTVQVELHGSWWLLDWAGPGSETVRIDLQGRGEGTAKIPITDAALDLPPGVTADSVQPESVTVSLQKLPGARPAPQPSRLQ